VEAIMTRRVLLPGILFAILLGALAGCKGEEPVALSALLEKEKNPARGTDFGEGFDRSLAVLDELASQKQDPAVGTGAILARARAHLDLLVAALLTEDPALYEKLKARLSWRLERPLTDPRNFQLLAQDLLESFRLVGREAAASPDARKSAEALALFSDGIQGILFRNKSRYFQGRDAVAAFPELRYLDDLMAVRDLVHESLRRDGAPAGNWQNITLTVVGRVCPPVAARYLAQLCSTPAALADPAKDDYCTTDFAVFPEAMRKEAGKQLEAQCHGGGGGEDAVKAYYTAAFDRLAKEADSLPVPTRDVVRKLSVSRDAAFGAIHMLFSGIIQQ
jgi:hypothetical protein